MIKTALSFQVHFRHVLIATSGLLLGCCIFLAATLLGDAVSQYRLAESEAHDMERFEIVLRAVDAVSGERRPSNDALTSGAIDRLSVLQKKRRETDDALDAVKEAFAKEFAADQTIIASYATLQAKLRVARIAVDRVSSLLPRERRSNDRILAMESMFAAADAVLSLRDRLGRATISAAPTLAAKIHLLEKVSTLRDVAGRLGSYAVMELSSEPGFISKTPLINAELTLIKFIWSDLDDYAIAFLEDDGVDAAIDRVNGQYFRNAIPYLTASLQNPDANPVDFTARYVKGIATIEHLRTELIRLTVEHARHQLDASRTKIWFCIAYLVAIFAVFLASLYLANILLFRPLLKARERVLRLTEGHIDGNVHIRTRSVELQQVFDAIAVVSQHLVEKEALEQEQISLTAKLRFLSERDPLTKLLNRRAIDQLAATRIEQADAAGRQLAVMIMDLDFFKRVNDTYGHPAGDIVLQSTAEKMTQVLRERDSIARFGGEEFVAILDVASSENALEVAERLRSSIEQMELAVPEQIRVTASIGLVVRAPRTRPQWSDLIAVADRRLYDAKRLGRNRTCSDDEASGKLERAVG